MMTAIEPDPTTEVVIWPDAELEDLRQWKKSQLKVIHWWLHVSNFVQDNMDALGAVAGEDINVVIVRLLKELVELRARDLHLQNRYRQHSSEIQILSQSLAFANQELAGLRAWRYSRSDQIEKYLGNGPVLGNGPSTHLPEIMVIEYKNWKGEISVRKVNPKRLYFSPPNKWHNFPFWALDVWDIDKEADRTFAMKDINFQHSRIQPIQ